MARVTVKEQESYFKELLGYGEKVKDDPELVQKILCKHISRIPHKKLYKFRTCSNQNLKILEENCIWIPPANKFTDTFDCTINIDLKANAGEIEKWLHNNLLLYYYQLIKDESEAKGIILPFSFQDFKDFEEKCVSSDGEILPNEEYEFMKQFATAEQIIDYDAQIEKTRKVRQELQKQMEEQFEPMAQTMVDSINSFRNHMRDTMLTYCMTERYDNNNLWETYADNYKGFCIEYYFGDFAEKEFEDYKNLIYLLPMVYRRKIPYFDVVPFIDGAMRKQVLHEDGFEHDPELLTKLNMQMFYKNKDYESEHEWRFSIKNKNNSKQPFPFVSAIYVGKDINKRNLSRLIKIADKLGVSVYKQTFNKAKNGYDYPPIEER